MLDQCGGSYIVTRVSGGTSPSGPEALEPRAIFSLEHQNSLGSLLRSLTPLQLAALKNLYPSLEILLLKATLDERVQPKASWL